MLPAAPTQQVAIRVSTPMTVSSVAQIRPASSTVTNIAGLPPGTTLLSGGSGLQGFALVPASYVTQVKLFHGNTSFLFTSQTLPLTYAYVLSDSVDTNMYMYVD